MGRLTPVTVAVVLLLSAACARGLYGPSLDTPITPAPRPLDKMTVPERKAMLDRAQVWRPIDTAKLDVMKGPEGEGGYAHNANVACDFAFPDEPLSGVTPKFECEVAPKDVVKVKYGEKNGEVYAEVAASRLFWALGFIADRMYPVKVTCRNCPDNPHLVSSAEWGLGRPAKVGVREFDPAAIERKFDGEEIEVPKYKGWSWRELDDVADNNVGASRAQIDGFKLLAAFIQHVDSKPENQALICEDESVSKDRDGNETCERPWLMIKDLGSSFAEASKVTFPKMLLESWKSADVWRDEKTCRANLTSSIVGTLSHPRISEAGRKFLADRLSLLTDQQLHDLFTLARVERRNETMDGRPVTAADWVQVFKAKRDEIVNHRCPS